MTTPPTHRSVAGLWVPLDVEPIIIEAFRDQYPGVTGELDDDAAIRAVLKHIVAFVVANSAAARVARAGEAEIEKLKATVQDRAEAARRQALALAQRIEDAPDGEPGIGVPIGPTDTP